MAVRRIAREQPENFAFSAQTRKTADWWIAKYPGERKRSAVIPLLWLAQKQDGWVSEPAMRAIADMLEMADIRVMEVATFYTMFNLQPVGEHHVQLCGTTPCMLRGAEDLKKVCREKIGAQGAISADGKLSWIEVECLGACCNAPMVQVSNAAGDAYYEDLDAKSFAQLLDDFAAGKTPKTGSAIGRASSEPQGKIKTLTDKSLYDGSYARPLRVIPNAPANDAGVTPPPQPVGERPGGLDAPRDGTPDDLKRISGVGPKLEETLHTLGVYHFDQIASWTRAHIDWVDDYLSFKGRIDREDWIAQAQALVEAGS